MQLISKLRYSLAPAALAEKREITEDQKAHLRKFLPALRFPLFELGRSADFLEGWISDTLPPDSVVDVSACLEVWFAVMCCFHS